MPIVWAVLQKDTSEVVDYTNFIPALIIPALAKNARERGPDKKSLMVNPFGKSPHFKITDGNSMDRIQAFVPRSSSYQKDLDLCSDKLAVSASLR